MPVHFDKHQGPRNRRRQTPADQIERLAKRGLTKEEIARELGITTRTFQRRLLAEHSLYLAWEKGAIAAGTYHDLQRLRTLEADEGQIKLMPVDDEVLQALKRKRLNGEPLPARKRMWMLREITGFDTNMLVKSIERLEANLKAAVHVGTIYTEYEAF